MLLSNISWYLEISERQFISFIKEKLFPYLNNGGVVQADYIWQNYYLTTKLRFKIHNVPNIYPERVEDNHVLTLRKK